MSRLRLCVLPIDLGRMSDRTDGGRETRSVDAEIGQGRGIPGSSEKLQAHSSGRYIPDDYIVCKFCKVAIETARECPVCGDVKCYVCDRCQR